MNLSVVVGTCDGYRSLWKNFQQCFNKYWDIDVDVVFVGETIEVPDYFNVGKYRTILSRGNWGYRMLEGINSVESDYIFFILEDYYFQYRYSIENFNNWIKDMENYSIQRLQISPSGHQVYESGGDVPYIKISDRSNYLISMQPSIWDKSFLNRVLSPNHSPWDFEIIGSNSLKYGNNRIYLDNRIPSPYFNAVRKGMVKSSGWEDFRLRENLDNF